MSLWGAVSCYGNRRATLYAAETLLALITSRRVCPPTNSSVVNRRKSELLRWSSLHRNQTSSPRATGVVGAPHTMQIGVSRCACSMASSELSARESLIAGSLGAESFDGRLLEKVGSWFMFPLDTVRIV